MKKFKKLTALVLAFLMMAVYVPVMAEETGTISGDTLLYAPPAGQYSAVSYQLKDASGNTVEDAVFTLNSAPTGVYVEGNRLILNGTTIQSGTISLSAASADGSVTAGPLSITVYENRIFFDGTGKSGTAVTALKPIVINTGETSEDTLFQANGTAANVVVKTESDGNEYLFADDDSYISMQTQWVGTNSNKSQSLTLQAKIKSHGQYVGANYVTILSLDSAIIFRMCKTASDTQPVWALLNRGDASGTDLTDSGAVSSGVVLNTKTWVDLKLKLDYASRKYSLYLDDQPVFENYTMMDTNTNLKTMTIKTIIDDLAIYSGDEYEKEVPYSIDGVDSIYLPETGNAATIPFVLRNKDDNSEVSDAVYSVSGTGVEMLSDGRLLVNGDTTPGTLTVSAYSMSEPEQMLATKTVTVEASKWFYDFESYDVGGKPSLTGSASAKPTPGQVSPASVKLTHKILAETDEENTVINKYYGYDAGAEVTVSGETYTIGPVGNNDDTVHRIINLDNYFSSTATVEFDFLIDETSDTWHYVLKEKGNGTNMQITYNNSNLNCAYNKSGEAASSYLYIGRGWHHIRAEFDNDSYSIWVDGNLWIDDFTNYGSKQGYLKELYWGSPVDNLSIYTGSNYNISASTSTTELTVPGTGTQSYDFTSVYSDGASISKALTYTLADEYTGVSLSGNTLSIASTAEMVPVTVNVTDGFVYGSVTLHTNKNYVLVNDALYAEGSDVINAADSYTIKAGYGSSKNKANYTLYIAQYEGGELVDLIPVSVSEDETLDLTAEYSGDFSATGFARVFLWDEGLVPVRADITVQ